MKKVIAPLKLAAISVGLAACLTGLNMVAFPVAAQAAAQQIALNENRFQNLEEQVVDGAIYVPLRQFFESLGAQVAWNAQTQTATATLDDNTIIVQIDNPLVLITQGAYRFEGFLDPLPRLVSGKTMVPIMALSDLVEQSIEGLQERVLSSTQRGTSDEEQTDSLFSIGQTNFNLAESQEVILQKFGSPDRIDAVTASFSWYVYNSDYTRLLMLGIENGEVAAVFSTSPYFSFDGLSFGLPVSQFERATAQLKGTENYIYKDTIDNGKCVGLMIKRIDATHVPSSFSQSYLAVYEKQVFDVTNGLRVQSGLKPLTHDELMQESARGHSQDMGANQYFSHESLSGLSPYDRMANAGLKQFTVAAENIASGFVFAPEVCFAWLNSPSHRTNLFHSELTRLGIGAAVGKEGSIYCTQNFYTP